MLRILFLMAFFHAVGCMDEDSARRVDLAE